MPSEDQFAQHRPGTTGDTAPVTGSSVSAQRDDRLAIRARGLSKSYPGAKGLAGQREGARIEAVRGIDLDVPAGETFGFLGPNGAGKSTVIGILSALVRPTAGQARVAGADVLAQPRQVRRNIGLLSQHSALDLDLSARQNLYVHGRLYGLSRRYLRERIAAVLELAGLSDRAQQTVRAYSGGMRRRLEIARGLLHAPRVLFLDEPTVGLDPHARARTWEHLLTLRDLGLTTVFVTTHYLEEAENCDRLAIIDAGRIVARGTPRALKAGLGNDRLVLRTSDDMTAAGVLREARVRAGSERVGPGGGSCDGAGPWGAESDVPPISDVTVDAGGVSVRVGETSAWIPRLCAALAQRDVTVHAVSATPPTLGDVFFHHTGRTINADAGRPV